MCFRPAEISMNTCPQCGASNKPIATVCAQCGAPLEQVKVDFDADQAKLDSFNQMPPLPTAPGAPSAPKPPAAPGAPGTPTVPPKPTAPNA